MAVGVGKMGCMFEGDGKMCDIGRLEGGKL